MQNFINEKNNRITYSGQDIIAIIKEISYILCSLHDMGSFYVEKPIIEYEKETTSFIDNSIVCDRLAAIRGCSTKNINLDEGEDGLDDIERACENIEYWSKPGDYSKEIWLKK